MEKKIKLFVFLQWKYLTIDDKDKNENISKLFADMKRRKKYRETFHAWRNQAQATKNKDYKNLSNLLLFKLQFQNNELEESLKTLKLIEDNVKGNSTLNKIIKYYYSQVFMEQNNKKSFDLLTNELLSFGGMWALLSHELRGHLYFFNKDYENALKNFRKIIQNQQSTISIRNRAQEMIDNINLHYDKNN